MSPLSELNLMTTRPDQEIDGHACQATAPGRGAVATILIRCGRLLPAIDHFFRPASQTPNTHSDDQRQPTSVAFSDGVDLRSKPRFGRWVVGGFEEEVVLSQTSEFDCEIHCHGGAVPVRVILDSLIDLGIREWTWEEWLEEFGVNRLRTEASIALSQATTLRTSEILLDQLNGSLECDLRRVAANALAGDWTSVESQLNRWRELLPVGLHLVEPWNVVFAGPANVGKSSLLNACVGFARAIVLDEPGTTRDSLSVLTAYDGWPLRLYDTAGIRDAESTVEREGIDRSHLWQQKADCLVWVSDLSESVRSPKPAFDRHAVIHVGNKIDLINSEQLAASRLDSRNTESVGNLDCDIQTSAIRETGIRELLSLIIERLIAATPNRNESIPFCERHDRLLGELSASLANESRSGIVDTISEWIGPSASGDGREQK